MTSVIALLIQNPRDALAIAAVLGFFYSLHVIKVHLKEDLAEIKAGQKELVKIVQDLRVEQVRLSQIHTSFEDVAVIQTTLYDLKRRLSRVEGIPVGI